jgi:SNF2 family DNA or RNA helicase
VDHLDIFYMYAEMWNNECTEMGRKFQDLPNCSVFVTIRKMRGKGLNLTAGNDVVLTQKFRVFNEQWQEFARVVQLG